MNELEALKRDLDSMTEELSRRYEELSLLYEVAETMGSLLDVDRLPLEVVNKAMDLLGAKRGYFMLFNPETFALEIKAARGFEPEILSKFKAEFKADEGIAGQTLRDGRVNNIDDISKIATEHNEAILGVKSLLCVPLKHKDDPIGVIGLADKFSSQPFLSPDVKLVSALAIQVSVTLQNARLFNNLQDLFVATIGSLTCAIDEKDAYTHGHSNRVTQYAVEIGKALNFSNKKLDVLELSAALHDVGKIGISDAVLGKPGKLTEEEWQEIKKHPGKGVHILKPVEGVEEALYVASRARILVPKEDIKEIMPGIKHHHERYDGRGYPDGLAGEDIPLFARIIAVADAFDAMTSNRSYRAAFTQDEALAELKRNAGYQHDPNIVEVFIDFIKKKQR